ncbi:hypothetical protein BDV12DRAFT_104570 [Aspergillus spectabilis]
MSEALFVDIRLLSAKRASNANWKCAALLTRGGGQCETQLPMNCALQAEELHDKLHGNNESNSALRTSILEQIAKLCLCGRHDEAEAIAAAVNQWKRELQPRLRPAEPQTPVAKKGAEERLIEFTSYTGTKYKINPDDPTQIDDRIRQILGGKIGKNDKNVSYLYVFSRKNLNKGMYKVGFTHNLSQRRKDLEECYGELELHCFVECANVRLFEHVVHAELIQYRRKHPCENEACRNDEHTEWFETSLHDILDTVMAWSLYARLLHSDGFALDRNSQVTPVNLVPRPDRWRRWALEETLRWMDQRPIKASVVPRRPMFRTTNETLPVDESDFETASNMSSAGSLAGSLADTPGTTPDTTPLTTPGSFGGGNDDYSLSPTPAEMYTECKLANISDEDEDNGQDGSFQSVKRALFKSPKERQPRMSERELRSDDLQTSQSTRRGDSEDSNADPVSEASSMKIPSGRLIDQNVRKILEEKPESTESGGIIYLTPQYEQTGRYKIYIRGSRYRGSECYAKQEPYCWVACTNKMRVEKLVLAEFGDRRSENSACNLAGCKKNHTNWIKAPGDDIKASIKAWTKLIEVGYESTDVPGQDFSRDAGRWTEWAKETAKKNEAREKAARDEEVTANGRKTGKGELSDVDSE